MAGTSVYPGALDNWATNKTNATFHTNDHPQHHNDLADSVNKVEAELGVNPSGPESTVAARFTAIDDTLNNLPPSGGKEIQIDLTNPQQAANGGNVVPTVVVLTSWELYGWSFAAATGQLMGNTRVPSNLTPPANPRIYLEWASATTGTAVNITVGASRVQTAGSWNPGSLATNQQPLTIGTAWQKYTTVHQPTWILSGGDSAIIRIQRDAAGGNAGAVVLISAWLEVLA